MEDCWFGVVRWCNGDIISQLETMGIAASDDNVNAVRCACENNHHFTDGMIEAGWESLSETIASLRDEGKL